MRAPRRLGLPLLLIVCASLGACTWRQPDRALHVATGSVAHNLCTETFVSGLDPDQTYAESLAPMPGFEFVRWGIRYRVDRERKEVQATFAGGFESRAVFRDRFGCVLIHDHETIATPSASDLPPLSATPALEAPVEPADPRLKAALDAAFVEPAHPPHRWTKAVVVMQDGKIVAERYAPGYTVDTPILAFSVSKSVTNALIGILVREGRLKVNEPAPFAAWQDANDPRHPITIEQLMRMTSGLDLDETGTGFDPSNQMFYDEPDMAAYAESAKLIAAPGTRWHYSSASTHLLARIVRDAAGGNADAVQRFAFDELFGPVGMRHVTMEMDATGTPVGAHYMLASARDWARFGQLYLQDGVIDGKRILPAGWIAFSTTPTLDTTYGAGWWVNRRVVSADQPAQEKTGMPLMPDVPADTFYALGNLGQYIAVVPSKKLVVVRLGRSHEPFFGARHFEALLAACVAATSPP
jgi:CubicO group peptidase (beta-lactamase class C family)